MAAPRQPRRFSSFSLYHFIGFASLLFRFFFFHHLEREYIASANCSSSNFLWLDSYNLKRNRSPSLLLYHYIRITLVPGLITASKQSAFLTSRLYYFFCCRHKQTGSIPFETLNMIAEYREIYWRVQCLPHSTCCRATKVNISFNGAIKIVEFNCLRSTKLLTFQWPWDLFL